LSHRRRNSLSRPSTNPTRPDLLSGLSRLPYPMFALAKWRIIQHAEIWGGRAPTVVVYRRELPLRWNWNATTASVGVPAYVCL
jgi:hypothetical protein